MEIVLVFLIGIRVCLPVINLNDKELLAAATAKSLQSCLTLCDPIGGSPPGSANLGFSRQEHWSGLPFPSPMHESEKRKWSHSVVSDSSRPHGLQPTRLLHPWDFPGKGTRVGCRVPGNIQSQKSLSMLAFHTAKIPGHLSFFSLLFMILSTK